jgi:23S rRNA pseudouridine2604 synthase
MSTRAKLTAKHPRAATPERAPVRRGSTTARKPVKPAAPPGAPKTAKPAGAPGAERPPRGTDAKTAAPRERDAASRPPRAAQGERPARSSAPAYGERRGGVSGGKPAGARGPRADMDRPTGERRRASPARDGDAPRQTRAWARDDDRPARPRREGYDDERRPARPRSAGAEGERRPVRSRGEGAPAEGRPARARSEGYGDERRPPRPRSEGFGDERRPPRPRSEGYGDERRPPRPRSEGYGDERRPPRPRSEGYGDERRPPRPRSEGYGDERRPPRARSASHDDERRPARTRSEGFGEERRPARPRGEGADDRKRPFGDRKPAGAAPRREFGNAEGRRSRDDRGATPGSRRTSEERGYARPAKATYGERDRDAAPTRRRTSTERDSEAPRPRRSAGDAPVRKIATRVKQDSHAHDAAAAEPTPRRVAHEGEDAAGSLRLSKRMSELGLCSRREADEWIEKGWVFVDGERIDTLGSKVTPDQRIEIDPAARAAQARQVTILLHKPVGYVSGQAEDGYEPAVTLVTAENQWEGDRSGVRFSPLHLRTLAPAGRLDIDSTGLLVLTQDGRVAKQLIGEQSDVDKEYLVRVTYDDHETDIDQYFPAELLAKLRHGLSLDDVPLKPAMVSWQNGEQLRFVLREGKKRQIRRMCELVGLKVVGLKRVRMGRVLLGALPQGQWRYLTPDESF